MAVALFVLGLTAVVASLITILAREHHDTLRQLSSQSARIGTKSLTDSGVSASVDSAAHLIDSVAKLVQTSAGTGAFLGLLGLALCVLGYLILVAIP